jgi:MYXO-CTERM domain-containing protein
MKKLLTLAAVALVVGSASAVTMDWGTSVVQFDGSTIKSSTAVTGYLIAVSSLSSYTVDGSFDEGDIGTVVNEKNKTSAAGKIKNTWTGIDTDTYSNGSTFAVLLKYVNGEDTYWNLAESLVSISGMSVDPPVNASEVTAAFSYGNGTDGTLAAGGGWVKAKAADPVIPDTPEPATGALALAGIALLFRRRRA